MLRGRWYIDKGEVSLFDFDSIKFPQLKNINSRIVELTNFFVPRKSRGRGYGRILVEAALAYARRYKWAVIIRIHPYDNEPLSEEALKKFYKKFGFKVIPKTDNYYYLLETK